MRRRRLGRVNVTLSTRVRLHTLDAVPGCKYYGVTQFKALRMCVEAIAQRKEFLEEALGSR